MNDPHVDQAYRLALQYAVREDPGRFPEAAQRVRTLDRRGEVSRRELTLLAIVAALRQGDESGLEHLQTELGEPTDADRHRLRELFVRTPEHSAEAFRRRVATIVERPSSNPVAQAASSPWTRVAIVAGVSIAALAGGYVLGGRASLWPLPSFLAAQIERPETALRDVTIDLLTADLGNLWDRLPPAWREDADSAMAKLVRNVEAELLRSMRELLEAYATVLENKGEFVVGSSTFDDSWIAAWTGEVEGLGEALRRLAGGPLLDPSAVRSFDMGEVLATIESSRLAREVLIDSISLPVAREMGISAATIRRPDARRVLEGRIGVVVKAHSDDYATVELSCGDWERSVEMIREQGRWVSEPMARWWETTLSQLRMTAVEIRTFEGQQRSDELLRLLAAQRQELDLLATAQTQSEFDEIAAGIPARMFVRLNLW